MMEEEELVESCQNVEAVVEVVEEAADNDVHDEDDDADVMMMMLPWTCFGNLWCILG